MQNIVRFIDRMNDVIGSSISWLTVLMVIVTFLVVVLRYVFSSGWIAMQESIIYMHSIVFMLGVAYTLKQNGHVRVDIFLRKNGAAQQGLGRPAGCRFPADSFLSVYYCYFLELCQPVIVSAGGIKGRRWHCSSFPAQNDDPRYGYTVDAARYRTGIAQHSSIDREAHGP